MLPALVGGITHPFRNRAGCRRRVAGLPAQRIHRYEIDHTDEVGLASDRKLQDNRMRAETIGDHFNCPFEVRAGLIHLVDEAEARHVKTIGLTPNRFRLRLYAGDSGKDGNCAIKHAERTFDFDLKVDMSGRVDDRDGRAPPFA